MKKLYFTLLSFLFLLIHGASAQSFSYVDIYSGGGSSNPTGMTVFNGKVYFQAESDTLHGYELWSTDGTSAGTSLVADIWPGPGSSYPANFIIMGNKMFFTATDSIHGYELWVTDGTTSGTTMVADVWPGPGSGLGAYFLEFTVFNGKLYFDGTDSLHGTELWVSDGTSAGTSLLKDIWSGPGSSSPYESYVDMSLGGFGHSYTEFNNKLYFNAADSLHGAELWVTDGTTAGTSLVVDAWQGTGSGYPYAMTVYNGSMIFSDDDSIHGRELWISDGTTAGTVMLKDINPGLNGSDAADYSDFTLYNGKLYFSAMTDATGHEMWVTDGTSAGTSLVADVWAGPGESFAGDYGFQLYNGKLFFNASDSLHGNQLWTSDGTTAGTSLVKVLSNYTPDYSYPYHFINFNGKLFFLASVDSINQEQLFVSDGTSSGTQILSPAVAPNTNPLGYYYPTSFCLFNNSLMMNANFNSIGDELWIYGFPAGINPVSGDHTISAYPNPFGSTVTISGLESSGQYSVQLVDMTGREYYSTMISNPSQNASVTLPDLTEGIYLMRISGQGSSHTLKLVKN